jgi:hypothetical protein
VQTRRSFFYTATAMASSIILPIHLFGEDKIMQPLSFGLIAVLHQDIMRDAEKRVGVFISEMDEVKPDFICQLGDCYIPP